MKTFLSLLAAAGAGAAVFPSSTVPNDVPYFTAPVRNTELIYTRDHLTYAQEAAKIETALQPAYEALYGYTMDEPLYVGILSDRNQIANGYSSPYPNNRQINYGGGALMIDYFASPSWLKTLLYHETAHNYQMNAKESFVSEGLHTVLRNGTFFVPWFTLPNIVESSFLLEGNAVLNESWHGNGGRLYSGRFKAATLQQAKAGYLTPERVFNANYDFLYGSHFYTLGGYYQYYLAETYGLADVNAYWRLHSRDWFWPFFTNDATQRAVGVDFDTSFNAWRAKMETEAAAMKDVPGDALATTQFYAPINGDKEAVYFIVNPTGRGFPERVVYRKADGTVTRTRGSYLAGKVVRMPEGAYATQGSAYTSPWRISEGLYDEDAHILEGTQSKIVEGYLRNGTPVYFDVPSSFDQPQLYVGETFYARTNSSVYIDRNDDLYYFVQGEGKTRTLFKNRTPLFSIKGYYGNVSGVDSRGAVYFIANTPHGTGLFRYRAGRVTRAHDADTIMEARLIDDTHALAAVMGSDAYTYKVIALGSTPEPPFEVSLFVEQEPYYRADVDGTYPFVGFDRPYRSPLELHYSGTDLSFGSDSDAGFLFDLSANFADPLTRNTLSAFVLRNVDEYTLAGARYANSEYFLQFALSAYGILDRPEADPALPKEEERTFGVAADVQLPFWRRGYEEGTLSAHYFQDYESDSRTPLSAALALRRTEQYGVSMYPNFLLSATPYASFDRGDSAFGGEGAFGYGFAHELYLGLDAQYSASSAESGIDERGIKLATTMIDKLQESDPTTVVMPSLKDTAYAKSAFKAHVQLQIVFNLSAYFFTFPLSLRREALRAGYAHYDLGPFGSGAEHLQVNETSAGITFDTFWFNKLPIPITVDYYHSDTPELSEEHTVRIGLGIAF